MKNILFKVLLLVGFSVFAQSPAPKVEAIRFVAVSAVEMNAFTRAEQGTVCYRSDTNSLFRYDGSSWSEISSSGTAGADWNTNLINIPADIADGDDDTKNSQAETVAQVSAEYPNLDTDGTDDVNIGNIQDITAQKTFLVAPIFRTQGSFNYALTIENQTTGGDVGARFVMDNPNGTPVAAYFGAYDDSIGRYLAWGYPGTGIESISTKMRLNVNNGDFRLQTLSGTGNRMVIANEDGDLSTQAIPSGGSSTDDQQLTRTGNTLNLEDGGSVDLSDLAGSGSSNNFEAYGAIGDGVTDDTAALQAAVDAGGVLIIDPSKTYNISQQVDINNPVTIHFQGAKTISSTSRRMFRVNSSDVHLLDFDIENTVVDATEDLLGLIYGVGVDMNNVTITGKIDGGGQSYINAVKFVATNSKMTNFRFDLECYNIGRMGWEFISHTNDNDDDFKAENIHIERFISDNTGAAGSSGQPISFSGNIKNSSARNIVANDFTDIGIEVASCYSVLVENATLTNPKLASDRFFTSFKNVGYTQNNIIFRDIKTEGTGKIEMSSTGKAVLVDNLTTKDAVRIEGNNAQIINSDIETSLLVQALENDFKISNSKVRFTTGGRFSATTGNFFMENVDAVTDLDGQIFDGGTGRKIEIRNSTFTNGFFNVDADVDLFNFKFNSTASPTRFRGTGTYTYDYVFDNGVKVADTHRAGATGGGDLKSDGTVAMTAPLRVQTIQSTSSDFITQTSSGQRLMRVLDFANAFSDNTTSTFFQMGRNSAIFTANAGAILSRVGYTVQDGVVIGNVAFGSLPAPTAMLDVLGNIRSSSLAGTGDRNVGVNAQGQFIELASSGGALSTDEQNRLLNASEDPKTFLVSADRALTAGDRTFDSGADIGRKKVILVTDERTLTVDDVYDIDDIQRFETQGAGVLNLVPGTGVTIEYKDKTSLDGVSMTGDGVVGLLRKKSAGVYIFKAEEFTGYAVAGANILTDTNAFIAGNDFNSIGTVTDESGGGLAITVETTDVQDGANALRIETLATGTYLEARYTLAGSTDAPSTLTFRYKITGGGGNTTVQIRSNTPTANLTTEIVLTQDGNWNTATIPFDSTVSTNELRIFANGGTSGAIGKVLLIDDMSLTID